jgi:hypothetical protein
MPVRAVAPRPAFVTSQHGAIVVFADEDDEGAPQGGEHLSAALDCIAVSVGIHGDDFMFEVHDRGRPAVNGAVPDPAEYFGFDPEMLTDIDPALLEAVDAPSPSASGAQLDPDEVVRAVQRGDADAGRVALAEDFVCATDRHEAIAKALGLPRAAVGWGYRYLSQDAHLDNGPTLIRI